jgi:hypothetical protein
MNSLRFFVIFISLLCLFLTNSHADEVRIGIVRHDVVSNLKQAFQTIYQLIDSLTTSKL